MPSCHLNNKSKHSLLFPKKPPYISPPWVSNIYMCLPCMITLSLSCDKLSTLSVKRNCLGYSWVYKGYLHVLYLDPQVSTLSVSSKVLGNFQQVTLPYTQAILKLIGHVF
jgi:hypothetical protein